MDHEFSPSLTDDKKCLQCKRSFRDHSKVAQCEACPAIGPCEIFCDLLLCKKCLAAEMKAVNDYQAPELQEQRLAEHTQKVKLNELLEQSNKIDQSITLVTDLFNAHTVSFVDLGKAIDEDANILNKAYTKAQQADARIKHLQTVLFDYKQKVVDMENGIRAGQVYINSLLNLLKDEERAELKLKDISYPIDKPKTPKAKSTGTKAAKKSSKIDMSEVIKWASKLNIPAAQQIVHMRMLAKNMSAEAATRTYASENNIDLKD